MHRVSSSARTAADQKAEQLHCFSPIDLSFFYFSPCLTFDFGLFLILERKSDPSHGE